MNPEDGAKVFSKQSLVCRRTLKSYCMPLEGAGGSVSFAIQLLFLHPSFTHMHTSVSCPPSFSLVFAFLPTYFLFSPPSHLTPLPSILSHSLAYRFLSLLFCFPSVSFNLKCSLLPNSSLFSTLSHTPPYSSFCISAYLQNSSQFFPTTQHSQPLLLFIFFVCIMMMQLMGQNNYRKKQLHASP